MLLPVQLLILAFVLFALARAFSQFRAGRLGLGVLIGWIVLWIAVAAVAVLPWTTTWLAQAVGVGRGVDLVIYVSLAALFYLVFRLFVKIEETERSITRLVRALALKTLEEDEKK